MYNGVLNVNDNSIPVIVEQVEVYHDEPTKITLRKKYLDGFSANCVLVDETHCDRYRDYALNILGDFNKNKPLLRGSDIKEVIFNGPATIVKWTDGTKTVVKCQPDDVGNFNFETGIALAVMKKAFGNKGNFNNVMKKLITNAKYE